MSQWECLKCIITHFNDGKQSKDLTIYILVYLTKSLFMSRKKGQI
jgi:hypothetical protein